MSDENTVSPRRHFPVFEQDGPVSSPVPSTTVFYDPMRAARRVDDSFYRGPASKAALERRTGFPSYLTQKPDDPSP